MFFFDSLAIPPMAVGEVAEGSIRSGQDRSQIGKEIDRYIERERERERETNNGNGAIEGGRARNTNGVEK
jgi:hypothetical protein